MWHRIILITIHGDNLKKTYVWFLGTNIFAKTNFYIGQEINFRLACQPWDVVFSKNRTCSKTFNDLYYDGFVDPLSICKKICSVTFWFCVEFFYTDQ